MEEDIKSEISGNFQSAVLALLEPLDEYDAHCLRKAIKGVGTNEKIVIQTLCPKEAHEIEILRAAYKRCIFLFKNILKINSTNFNILSLISIRQ